MKLFVSLFALLLTFNVFASAGVVAVSNVLIEYDVEKLDDKMRSNGFTLTKIENDLALRGVIPRCPCMSLNLTFTKVSGGKAANKKFNVYTQGLGSNLEIKITPQK